MVCGAPPALAQSDTLPWGIGVAIGPIQSGIGSCSFEFVVMNQLELAIDRFEAVVVGRDRLDAIDRTLLTLGPVPRGDQRSATLSLEGGAAGCDSIQLVEVVLQACEVDGSDRFEGCLALMRAMPRGGRPLLVNRNPMPMTVGARPQATRAADAEARPVPTLAATVGAITSDLAERFDLPSDAEGVVVIEAAEPESRLLAGDVIVEIDQDPVATADDVDLRIADAVSADRESLLLLVLRDGEEAFIVAPIAAQAP